MGNISWTSIIWAGLIGFFLVRMWPNAMNWIKNGPKGDSNDWTVFIVLMAAVALLVMIMISIV